MCCDYKIGARSLAKRLQRVIIVEFDQTEVRVIFDIRYWILNIEYPPD